MAKQRLFSDVRLVNGSTGDPVLFIDYPGKNDALLFDAGDNSALDLGRLGDVEAVFITHHHIDHFIGFDRILRANMNADKTVHVFGPTGTIGKIYDRIKSYEFAYFPFQKIVLRVTEIVGALLRTAVLECTRRFPEPVVEERPWIDRTVFESGSLRVEAAHADHTVPCLSYALVESDGYHPSRKKLARGALRPGPWIEAVRRELTAGAPPETRIDVQGGAFPLSALAERYFDKSSGGRVAFVTDTLWGTEVKRDLVALARRATRLYCDSFYASAQLAQAQKYRHMTARHAAELATAARVRELVLMHFAPRYRGRYHLLLEEAREGFGRVSAEIPS